ncbi:MAG: DUF805 domain-containing protein [Marinobacter sp.]|uniref:DUF805 domain-containing protein n=1 Tax=Marinobacter sp. TaxID=50741 RepID=UPI003C415B8F
MKYLIDPFRFHYFDFTGRATRKQFWIFLASMIVISFVIGMIDAFITFGFVTALKVGIMYSEPYLTTPFVLLACIPLMAITTRRLHDANRNGLWQLLLLIPFLGWFILIAMLMTPSKAANKYGDVPA